MDPIRRRLVSAWSGMPISCRATPSHHMGRRQIASYRLIIFKHRWPDLRVLHRALSSLDAMNCIT
jgi:hypothetical protein